MIRKKKSEFTYQKRFIAAMQTIAPFSHVFRKAKEHKNTRLRFEYLVTYLYTDIIPYPSRLRVIMHLVESNEWRTLLYLFKHPMFTPLTYVILQIIRNMLEYTTNSNTNLIVCECAAFLMKQNDLLYDETIFSSILNTNKTYFASLCGISTQ